MYFNSYSSIALDFENFSFIYGDNKDLNPVVSNISFKLKEGEILVLAGPSGSGKSTLSYAMNGIIPWRQKGLVKGDVKLFGKSIWDYNFSEISQLVSLVKQNPNDQLITFNVKDEIAFGLENLKFPPEVIEERVGSVSKLMGINHLLTRDIDQLSGGQKQLVILSSFLVMNPKLLILDEPIAFLDQQSESLLLNRLKYLIESKSYPITIVIIEHRLSRVMDIADKLVILNEQGNISIKGDIKTLITQNFDDLRANNIRVPWIIDIFNDFQKLKSSKEKINYPTNFQESLDLLSRLDKEELKKLYNIVIDKEINPIELQKYERFEELIEFDDVYVKSLKKLKDSGDKIKVIELDNILETRDLTFKYPNSGIVALKNLNLKISRGDFIGLVGPNGSGKTTLLYLLANLYEPTSGEIYYNNENISQVSRYEYAKKIGFIFQNPENMIFRPTLKEELLYGPKNFGLQNELNDSYINKLLNLVGRENPEKNPFHLSWGQKRRLNLSSIFIYNPEIILLDEPFIGQDQKTIDSLIETLYIENKRGKTIIISSHDYHLLLKYTKRIIELNKDGTLQDYDISHNYFQKHRNLGPIILLENIKNQLELGNNEK
ncbi:MAG: ABC transporter ATP-binding protein [Candidatus Thorarchaeota archaeon]